MDSCTGVTGTGDPWDTLHSSVPTVVRLVHDRQTSGMRVGDTGWLFRVPNCRASHSLCHRGLVSAGIGLGSGETLIQPLSAPCSDPGTGMDLAQGTEYWPVASLLMAPAGIAHCPPGCLSVSGNG